MTASPQPSEAPTSIALARVNVGAPSLLARADGTDVWSGIAKHPVPAGTTLWCSTVNLGGDGQADLSVHGGPDKAVYAYPSEHLGPWRDELGEELGDAPFGENLSTVGALEADVGIGDVWRWGDAFIQICQPRWPCFKLALHRQRSDIQKLMRGNGRTGWYHRVLEPGEVVIGDGIEIVSRDPAGLTVADAHTAMADRRLTNRTLVESLADHAALASEWRDPLQDRLATNGS